MRSTVPDVSGVAMKACVHSGWTNYYNKGQNYGAPTGHVMTGIFSVHNNHYQYVAFIS